MRKKFLLMLTVLVIALGGGGKLFAQELLVNCDYNSSTEGYGVTKFSNYAGAYDYATANAKKATIVVEKTNTLSGNTFDDNHKNYKSLAVVIKDGASMGNALSKWDMTYPVTVEPGGTLTCARPKNASVSNIHIKNTLTVGAEGSTKKAVVDFLSDTYQDCDISIRYNGKVLVYNADFRVQDLDAQGALTIEKSEVYVDGAFASATFYATTLTNSTLTIKGNQISGGLSDFAGGTSNQLGNVKLNNSTLTIEEGDTKVAANVTATNSTIAVNNLTVNSGKTLNLNEGSTLNANGITNNGTVKVDGEIAKVEGNQILLPVAKIGETKYETLSAAFAAVTADNQTVVVLRDVTENLTGAYLRGNITTENNAKVTITLTNSDWVYCPYTFVVGENVTLKVPALFYYAGAAQINGKVVAGAYYQRYAGTKLTINEPGSMTVTTEQFYLRYVDADANAGIYIIGDNNPSTIGLKLSVAYFYQGMINAKDANIVAGTYWQTNETDGQGSANLVLDNSTLTVTVYDHPAKATGNSTVTLTNGSVIDAKNGGFTYGDNTTLSVDATSKIIGKNGDLVKLPVAKIDTKPYTSLQAAVNAVQDGQTIKLVSDVTENVTLTEKVGLRYTIDGNDKTMNGKIAITPLSDENDNRRITIKNINFVNTADAAVDFISCAVTNHYPRLTVEGCDFTGNGKKTDVALRLKTAYGAVIKNCTGTGLHSFLQNTAGKNLTIEGVTVTNSKGAFALGTVQGVTVKGSTIDVATYGIRLDANTYNNNAVIESNEINAFIPVVVRNVNTDSNITFNGENRFAATNDDDLWCAIGATEYEANGQMPTAPATGRVKVALNGTGLAAAGIYGNFVPVAKIGTEEYASLEDAIAAATDGAEVVILEAGTYTVPSGKNLTITGAVDGVVFANIGAHNMGGANVTFNNVTFTYADNSTYKGLQHSGKLVYTNCTFNGQVFLYGASEEFNQCTFSNTGNNYNVWTYSAKEVAFNECTFNSAGKSVLIYAESKEIVNNVAVTKCTFKASQAVDGKAAIEMDSSLTGGIELTIDGETTAENFGVGNVSGNSLWNNKKGNATAANNDITVKVNGETVLAPSKMGTWGGIDWTLTFDGTLIIAPTAGEPVADKNAPTKRTYEVGEWREAVVYNSKGSASSIGGYPYDVKLVKKLVIKEGVTKIGSFTAQFPNLTGEVVIPSTVTYIGQEAFVVSGSIKTQNITKLTFAEGGTAPLCIANGAFKRIKIEEVSFPRDREYIHLHHWIFGDCPNLKYAYIPKNVTKSWGGEHVDYFDNFNSQSNVTWAEYGSIFTGCTKMETIEFENKDVRDLFFAKNRQSTDKDYIVAAADLFAYNTFDEALAEIKNGGDLLLVKDCALKESLTIPADWTFAINLNGRTLSQSKACTASYEMINNKGNLNIVGSGKISFKDTGAGDPNFGWGSYTVRNEGNLVVEKATIEHLGAQEFAKHMICAIFQYSGSTTINGGKISTPNYRSARLWKGDMTINGGTFDGQLWVQAVDNSAKLTINGGTFEPNGQDASAVFVTNNEHDVELAVAGGTFNGKIGCSDAAKLAGTITGGKFNATAVENTNKALLAEGVVFSSQLDDGYYAVSPETEFDATVGGVGYMTFADAFEAAKAGETIEMFDDVEATSVFLIDKSLTINGNGHKVTSSATRVFRVTVKDTKVTLNNVNMVNTAVRVGQNDIRGISVDDVTGVKLTLNNCSVDFTDESACDWSYAVNVFGGSGHDINVNGGTYEGANVINVRGAGQTVLVKDATLTSLYPNNDQYYGACIWVLQNQDSSVEATGNTFNGNNAVAFNVGVTPLTESNNTDNTTRIIAKIGEEYYTLQEAIDAAGTTETTITITADFETDDDYTIDAGQNIILNLNGKTITGTDNATGSFGLFNINPGAALTINDGNSNSRSNTAGAITLKAKKDREWSAYSSVISNQRGTLVVNGGTIQHLGGTAMAYGIDNLTNTDAQIAETTINGGTVKSTYRAIRQFLNSSAEGVNNILTVNGGTIEGGNKSIWMQDANANANPGTLTVGENAALKGDAYLSVTAGSTQWPVTVVIAAEALTDGSEVLTNDNVPEGYLLVKENNGYYSVKTINKIDQTISLKAGWTWTSLFVDATSAEELYKVQSKLDKNGVQIKNQTSATTRFDDGWYGKLQSLSVGDMYMVKVEKEQTVTINDYQVNPADYTINLVNNWTWIGFPAATSMTLDVLDGIEPVTGDQIKTQDAYATYMAGYGWYGSLKQLTPGRGYMYKNVSGAEKQLTYPSVANYRGVAPANITAASNLMVPNMSKYANNMNITAVVNIDGEELMTEGFEVAVFAGNELRGSARPIYIEEFNRNMLFLTVYGEETEELTFKYYDLNSGKEFNLFADNEVVFEVNATLGSLEDAIVLSRGALSIDETSANSFNVYPNPVNRDNAIRFETTYEKVEVYNSLGVVVAEYANVDQISGIEAAGIYVIKVANDNVVKYSRVIVK